MTVFPLQLSNVTV